MFASLTEHSNKIGHQYFSLHSLEEDTNASHK